MGTLRKCAGIVPYRKPSPTQALPPSASHHSCLVSDVNRWMVVEEGGRLALTCVWKSLVMKRTRGSIVAVGIALLAAVRPAASEENPPPSNPAARIAQRHRFLLYDTIFHEQVNKQRRALMFYLNTAMQLKRTLVLPRTRLLRRKPGGGSMFDPNADYVAWGELFNVSLLSKIHPVMELEQYMALHGGVSLHVKISHQGCAPSDGETTVPFNGLADGLAAARSVCDGRLQYDVNALKSAQYADEESIAFSDSVDQLPAELTMPLRPYVRYTDPVYEAATAFANERFGGEPFLAIHWRRTDFLMLRQSHEWALQSADMVIRHAKEAMRVFGLKHVYLATDTESKGELAQVTQALNAVRYKPKLTSLLTKTVGANIEITICALANRFFGTRTSSFSLAIMEERQGVFGHAADTGVEMGKPPERSSKDEL